MSNDFKYKVRYRNKSYLFRQIQSQERFRFDTFIQQYPHGNLFQSYSWGELKKSHGWLPIRLILEDKDNIVGAVTILKRSVVGMTLFYSPRGPVIDSKHQAGLLSMFREGITALARQENAIFWRIDPELSGSFSAGIFTVNGFSLIKPSNSFGGIQPKWVWRIPLGKTEQDQKQLLKKSARRNLKKAKTAGVEIKEGRKEDLPTFYWLLQQTAQRNNFLLRGIDYYHDLWEKLSPLPGFKLLIAYNQQKPVSCALAVGFGQGVWDIYAGNADANRDTGASYLLTWELISWACRQGYTFYCLGGVAPLVDNNHPLNGLMIFKSQFGGEIVEFVGEYDLVFNPMAYRLWQFGQTAFILTNKMRKVSKLLHRTR